MANDPKQTPALAPRVATMPEPKVEVPANYSDGTWWVPAGFNDYVKKPKE